MNAAAATAFVFAGVFAAGNWVAKARASRPLEYVCKPATLMALIAAAVVLDPATDLHDRRAWFVAALAASLAGDVALMLPRDRFVAGLGAFLVAHLGYIAGFWTRGPSAWVFAVAGAATAAAIVPLGTRIHRALQRQPALRAPVVAYMAVIGVMLASAIAAGPLAAAAGAALFTVSDAMIAWSRFVRPWRGAQVAIMVTYHLGQAGLVLSLLG